MTEASPPPNLLIVDDDRSLALTLVKILQKSGYAGGSASTGGEGIRLAREAAETGRPLSAVLVDLRLPDMTGLDVLREIHKLHPHAGIVMLTGHADAASAIGALNEGAFAYILKPYNVDDVKATLTRAVERQKLLSENRRLVDQLRQANAGLEEKVGERTMELQRANLLLADTIEKLQSANDAKSEFVSMVSHEFRTPLTIIIGFTETLLNREGRLTPEQKQHYLNIIREDAKRLSRLIEDMLNLSKIRDRKLHLTCAPFDLKAKATQLVEGFKILKKDMRFELSFDEDAREIVSDKDRVEQVMLNVVSNAVKYSPEDGLVKISVRVEGTQVVFGVEDQGPGISAAEREKIFEAFYRTQDAINMKSPGTGLGLTISKAIVEALGGRIWVTPGSDGRGSCFFFTTARNAGLMPVEKAQS